MLYFLARSVASLAKLTLRGKKTSEAISLQTTQLPPPHTHQLGIIDTRFRAQTGGCCSAPTRLSSAAVIRQQAAGSPCGQVTRPPSPRPESTASQAVSEATSEPMVFEKTFMRMKERSPLKGSRPTGKLAVVRHTLVPGRGGNRCPAW